VARSKPAQAGKKLLALETGCLGGGKIACLGFQITERFEADGEIAQRLRRIAQAYSQLPAQFQTLAIGLHCGREIARLAVHSRACLN
jgi:hypothetical protein